MALAYKVLGQSAPTAATLTDLYTVPSATTAIVSSVAVCNTSTSATTFRIAVRINNAAISTASYVAYEIPINGVSTTEVALGITMGTADVLTVYSLSGTCSFNAFGVQIV
jgi:hypothetical protein